MKYKFNLKLTNKGSEEPFFNKECSCFDTIETLVINETLISKNKLIDNMIKLGYANLTPIEEYIYELFLKNTDFTDPYLPLYEWYPVYKKIRMKVEQSMNHNFERRLENLIDILSDIYKVEFKIIVE